VAAGETSIGELRGRRPRAISANGSDHGLLARGDEARECVYVDAGFAVRNCVRVRRLHMRARGRRPPHVRARDDDDSF